jgi:Tol biopolymer transport system component
LINVISGQELLGFRLTSPAIDMRSASHRIADMIFEELTGIPSSRANRRLPFRRPAAKSFA